MKYKSYRNLILLPTFEERYEYLKIQGVVGESLFGFDRYMNQEFYTSKEWRQFRNRIITRDEGCDLGMRNYPTRVTRCLTLTTLSAYQITRIRRYTSETKHSSQQPHSNEDRMIHVHGGVKRNGKKKRQDFRAVSSWRRWYALVRTALSAVS